MHKNFIFVVIVFILCSCSPKNNIINISYDSAIEQFNGSVTIKTKPIKYYITKTEFKVETIESDDVYNDTIYIKTAYEINKNNHSFKYITEKNCYEYKFENNKYFKNTICMDRIENILYQRFLDFKLVGEKIFILSGDDIDPDDYIDYFKKYIKTVNYTCNRKIKFSDTILYSFIKSKNSIFEDDKAHIDSYYITLGKTNYKGRDCLISYYSGKATTPYKYGAFEMNMSVIADGYFLTDINTGLTLYNTYEINASLNGENFMIYDYTDTVVEVDYGN